MSKTIGKLWTQTCLCINHKVYKLYYYIRQCSKCYKSEYKNDEATSSRIQSITSSAKWDYASIDQTYSIFQSFSSLAHKMIKISDIFH